MNTIHERIKAARKAKEMTQGELAAKIGVTYQTVQQWENGATGPQRKRLKQVADALEVTPEYLSLGTDVEENGDHAPVPMVDAKASAGKGTIVFSDDVTKTLMFRRDWLRKNDAKSDATIGFEVDGDSMADMHIIHGAVVLANRRKTEPLSRRVYVVWINGKLYVKELVKKDGIWWARSHNAAKASDYPDIQIDDPESRVVGRAFWCGFGL